MTPGSASGLHWIVTWFAVWYELRVPFQCYSNPSGEAGEQHLLWSLPVHSLGTAPLQLASSLLSVCVCVWCRGSLSSPLTSVVSSSSYRDHSRRTVWPRRRRPKNTFQGLCVDGFDVSDCTAEFFNKKRPNHTLVCPSVCSGWFDWRHQHALNGLYWFL